jgi:tetratricopeptide (TPR) repeat protein
MGRFDESLVEIRRAQQLDPTSLTINAIAGQTYFFARRYDEAIEECRKALEMDADFFLGHDYLGWAYRQKGMHEEALAEFKKAKQIEDTPLQLCEIGIAYAASGNKEDARKVLHEVIESSKQKHAPQHSYRIARIYASLRERDAAFKSLEKAFNEREENLVWLKVDPHLDYLRPDPRFIDLLRRVGFAP